MNFPLDLRHLVWRMEHVHEGSEIVTASGTGEDISVTRRSFAHTVKRIDSLAAGLARLGVGPGDTVCSLAWNNSQHMEALLAVPCMGAVLNNVNLRLAPDVLDNLVANSAPAVLIVDADLLGESELAQTSREVVRRRAEGGTPIVVIGDQDFAVDFDFVAFEDLVNDSHNAVRITAPIDENAPAFLFHTSGTTGRPKTYEVSHRAALLHALSQATVDAAGLSRKDRVLPLAPFFHVNGWGLPLTAALTGASVILPGRDMGARRLAMLIRDEQVTVAAAVPTVWHDVCAAVSLDSDLRPLHLREVLSGGSAVPLSIVKEVSDVLGAAVTTAWGMTETMACSTYEREEPHESAGRPIPLIEIKIRPSQSQADDEETTLGRLDVRGALVVAETDEDGWFATGDMAVIDSRGRLILKDREKDLIKSGGEWIASAVLEQNLATHPAVAAAAVVPAQHPRWIERPVAYVMLRDGAELVTEDELREHLAHSVPRWWLPDRILLVEELPRTAVGKIDKKELRSLAENQFTPEIGEQNDNR